MITVKENIISLFHVLRSNKDNTFFLINHTVGRKERNKDLIKISIAKHEKTFGHFEARTFD